MKALKEADDDTVVPLGTTDVETDELKFDLPTDLETLQQWYNPANAVTQDQNEKLEALRKTLVNVSEQAKKNVATDPDLSEEEVSTNLTSNHSTHPIRCHRFSRKRSSLFVG